MLFFKCVWNYTGSFQLLLLSLAPVNNQNIARRLKFCKEFWERLQLFRAAGMLPTIRQALKRFVLPLFSFRASSFFNIKIRGRQFELKNGVGTGRGGLKRLRARHVWTVQQKDGETDKSSCWPIRRTSHWPVVLKTATGWNYYSSTIFLAVSV